MFSGQDVSPKWPECHACDYRTSTHHTSHTLWIDGWALNIKTIDVWLNEKVKKVLARISSYLN